MRTLRLSIVAMLVGCGPGAEETTDSAVVDEFCADLEDGGVAVVEEGGGNQTSGWIHVRMLTDESADPRDQVYVAFKAYTLESIEQGGVQTTGQTSGDGLVEELVGAGTWMFEAAYPKGSTTCTAVMEIPVETGNTTHACPVMTCP